MSDKITNSKCSEEKEELKIYNASNSGKIENQNKTHNSKKEGLGRNLKQR